jgi:outer membrane receptor protein involved in Fe transport
LSAAYAPLQALRLGLNLAYTDAKLDEPIPSLSGLPGARLPEVPRWSGSITADYEESIGGGWMGRVGGGFRYVGSRYSSVGSDPQNLRAAPYGAVDLYGGVSNERWELRLYVKNLTDRRAYLNPSYLTDVLGAPLPALSSVMPPRTVGLSFDVRF